jgi:CcmD family protein
MQQPAPQATQESAPEDRSQQFVAVTGGEDTTSAASLLVIAYIGMWLALFGFVWLTRRRQSGLNARLDTLEKALAHAEKSADSR